MGRRVILLYISLLSIGLCKAQIWKSIGLGIPNAPTAITTTDKLIATANLIPNTTTNSDTRSYLIKVWNGNYWQTLPPITLSAKGYINSLKFYKNALYIAGLFDTLNGLDSTQNIVRWSNGNYHAIPELWRDLNDYELIRGLNIYKNKLLVHGIFKHPEGIFGDGLVAFNSEEVVPIDQNFGSGVFGNIYSLNSDFDDLLVVGGRFTKVDGSVAKQLAYFSDGEWTKLTNNVIIPQKVIAHKEDIYFYGNELGGENLGFYKVNGVKIDTLNNGLTVVDKIYDFINIDGDLYASGLFQLTDADEEERRLIRWKNNKWEAVTNGNLFGITKLANQNNQLLASGYFNSYPNVNLPLNHIARYIDNAGLALGQVFFDKDKNCEFDKRDEQLSNMAILIESTGEIIKPEENGRFYSVLEEGDYVFRILRAKNWYANDACGGQEIKVHINKGEINDSLKFSMLQRIGARDLKIRLSSFSGQSAVNNAVNAYKLAYSNIGSTDIGETKIVLKFNDKFKNLSSKPEPNELNGDSAVWLVKDFYAGEARDIVFSFEISTEEKEIELQASIGIQEEEEDKADNKTKLTQVLGENDFEFKKYVLPGNGSDTATISPTTSKIGYQINFKNYTPDTVRTVYVIDTIKLNHSMSYIQEVGGSHPYSTNIYPGIPGSDVGILVYTFHNVNLHPNPNKYTDKIESFGYISFEIGLNKGLAEGMMLSNKAHVVFDYYEQEETNKVFAIIDAGLISTENIQQKITKVYPNPVNSMLNIELPGDLNSFEYRITTIAGLTALAGSSDITSIDVNMLSPGVYYLEAEGAGKRYYSKFVKL